MRPFRTDESEYNQSIAVDASSVGDITVTVAVHASRGEELDILDSIYTSTEGHSFYPFRHKSQKLDFDEDYEILSTIVHDNIGRISSTVHLGNDGSDQESIEAVQSAVLVKELEPSDTLVILDGDENKAKRFGRAFLGIRDAVPPVATCIQSELYYPSALLADLCASKLANEIDSNSDCSDVSPETPITKKALSEYWGPAYHSMVNSSESVQIEPIKQRRSERVSTRMHCWFNGYMGGGEPIQTDKSVAPISNYVRRMGYENLSKQFSKV